MADTSVAERASPIGPNNDWVVFDLGKANWSPAWTPDLETANGTRELNAESRLDVVVLCDGYTSKATFEGDLSSWITNLFQLDVFEWFRGAVRIRAVYTPSSEKASKDRNSFYRVQLEDDEKGISFDDWVSSDGPDNEHFRDTLWEVLDSLGINAKTYPSNLDAADPLEINDTYSHLTVGLLVRAKNDDTPSGRAVTVAVGPEGERLKVGIGSNWIHEFCHAFGYLADEYIDKRGESTNRSNPDSPGLYNITNKCYADTVEGCWWTHLAPFGDFPRAKGRNDPSPVVGWLWRGGNHELGVWHCEHRCLMNGTHKNYCHNPDPAEDSLSSDADGADLRIKYRFCLWCQELVAMRFHEKTGQLQEAGDPADLTAELGREYWQRWIQTWRARYYSRFDIASQIEDRESDYEAWAPTSGECADSPPLWTSQLYAVQTDAGPEKSSPVTLDVATLLPLL